MIRTENEYDKARTRLDEQLEHIRTTKEKLAAEGLTVEQLDTVLGPLRSFARQAEHELEQYDALKRGEVRLRALSDIGRYLVALRISSGLTQRDLAQRLNVHESQVSRDERHEYHGISVERADLIFGVLGAPRLRAEATFEATLSKVSLANHYEACGANDNLALAA